MRANAKTVAAMVSVGALTLLTPATPASADAISDWTTKTLAVVAEQRESPLSRARTLAIVSIAMVEAVNAVERGHTVHEPKLAADRNSAVEAAAATAAHDVLVALYPDRAPVLSPMLAAALAAIADGVPKARGYQLGKRGAAAVLAVWIAAPGGTKDAVGQAGNLAVDLPAR